MREINFIFEYTSQTVKMCKEYCEDYNNEENELLLGLGTVASLFLKRKIFEQILLLFQCTQNLTTFIMFIMNTSILVNEAMGRANMNRFTKANLTYHFALLF
jgi:hypothetical protein